MSVLKAPDPLARNSTPFTFRNAGNGAAVMNGAANAPVSEPAPLSEASKQSETVAKESDLTTRIAKLEAALADASDKLVAASSDAFERGKKAGIEQALTEQSENLDLLRVAIADSQTALHQSFDRQLETGIEIARAIIRRTLGDQAALARHVELAATHWKAQIGASSILNVRVSPSDFGQPDAIRVLESALKGTSIRIDPELDQGACVFDLRLGTLDASIPRQLGNAEELLDEYLSKEAHP